MTDVDFDERITALEENGGGGGSESGKLIFTLSKQQCPYMIYRSVRLTLGEFCNRTTLYLRV